MDSVATVATTRGHVQLQTCPGCGYRQDLDERGQCPKCGLDFAAHGATGEDISVYAQSVADDNPRWWAMCRWVWGAGAGRIQHLALMRSSPASRRFAARNLLLLSFALGIVLAAQRGWETIRMPLEESGAVAANPAGSGWLHLVTGRAVSGGFGVGVQVWWNPAQSILAGVAAIISGLLSAWVALLIVRGTVELAHRAKYRGEQRMSAALGYATAWIVAVLPAAALLGLWPLSELGTSGRLPWAPTSMLLLVLAGGLAGLIFVSAWFWAVRLGASAPSDTRTRVLLVFLVVIPAMLVSASVGWWIGMGRLLDFLFTRMNLSF